MAYKNVLAGVMVKDFAAAVAWYEKVLGGKADVEPMPGCSEWCLTESGTVQLIEDERRAGMSSIAIEVDDLDAHITKIQAAGVQTGGSETVEDFVRFNTLTDPEGNQVTFVQGI